MKVSVPIITFNHERYIAQAVDSALNQSVSFDYEIVIGEDCSTDRTREIIVKLASAHPKRIRLLLHDRNLGAARPLLPGRDAPATKALSGKVNFMTTLDACEGEYIAQLDGDDYWTDPRKLQKQVDFLDAHSDFSLCFHNAKIIREDGSSGPETFSPPNQKEISTVEDLLAGNFIHSGSTMFRRGLFKEFPELFLTSPTGDWALHVINARNGKIGYLNEVMAAYRVHRESAWSSVDRAYQLSSGVRQLDEFDRYLGFKYRRRIRETQYEYYRLWTDILLSQGDLASARSCLRRRVWIDLVNRRKPSRELVTRWIELEVPVLYDSIQRLRQYVHSSAR